MARRAIAMGRNQPGTSKSVRLSACATRKASFRNQFRLASTVPPVPSKLILVDEIDARAPGRGCHMLPHLVGEPMRVQQRALDPAFENQIEPVIQ